MARTFSKSQRCRHSIQHKAIKIRCVVIFLVVLLACFHWYLQPSVPNEEQEHSDLYTDTLGGKTAPGGGPGDVDIPKTSDTQLDFGKMDDTFIDTAPNKDLLKKEPIVKNPVVQDKDYLQVDNQLPIQPEDEKQPSLGYAQPYLLINRHVGAQNDIQYLADQLGFTFDAISKDEMFGEGINTMLKRDNDVLFEDELEKPIVKQYVDKFCSKYEVIIVADTNEDGRMLLERLDKRPQDCPNLKKLIFLTINRFDLHNGTTLRHPDVEKYYELIKSLMANKQRAVDIQWVANNLFDIKYAEIRLKSNIQNYQLIRSFGHSPIAPLNISEKDGQKVVMTDKGWQGCFFDHVSKRYGIPDILPLPTGYGGPETLAKYKAYVEIPYQLSTMKLYENLAHGVVMMIPSYEFYNRLLDDRESSCALYKKFQMDGFQVRSNIPDWRQYSDYYHPDFSDLIYYFDSFENLKDMLSRDILDTKNVRQKGPERFHKLRQESRRKWLKVFKHNLQS